MDPIIIGGSVVVIYALDMLIEYFANRCIDRQADPVKLLSEHYKPEEADKEMRTRCVDLLENQFPIPPELCMWERIQTKMAELSLEDRKRLIEDLYRLVAKEMKLDPAPILSIEPIRYYGLYNSKEDKFYLSETLLAEDKTCADIVQTIFHELKHTVQWRAIKEGGNVWGYSDDLLAEWALNELNYISPEVDPLGYLMQPMETDSFGFENYVLQNPGTPIDFAFLGCNNATQQIQKS